MKAKKFLLLAMSALAITTLGACRGGRGRGRGGSTSGGDVSNTTGGGGGGHVIPGGSGSQGGNSNSSAGGNSNSGSAAAKSITDVVSDINAAFNSDLGGKDLLSWNSSYNMYGGAINYSQDGESYTNTKAAQSVLQPAVEDMVTYMPSYLVSNGTHYWTTDEDYWEDGSGDTVYEAQFETSDGGVVVSCISYVYDSELLGQVAVYEPTE